MLALLKLHLVLPMASCNGFSSVRWSPLHLGRQSLVFRLSEAHVEIGKDRSCACANLWYNKLVNSGPGT